MPTVTDSQPAKLTDEEWQLIEPLLKRGQTTYRGGRHRQHDREIFCAIIWKLDRKNPWRSLPQSFPPFQTCHRRLLEWERNGTLAYARQKLRRFRELIEGSE